MASLIKTFSGTGDFDAMRDAEDFLKLAGFSVASNQRGAPRGIMFGDYAISKWRNLREIERQSLHGQMTGDMRSGPVRVEIFENAPQEGKLEFHKTAIALQLAQTIRAAIMTINKYDRHD
jgi:hypothetical protein